MNSPTTRGQAITAYCKGCIHDSAAARNWKQQVPACLATDCALWRFRPVGRGTPSWIQSREPTDLPKDWSTLPHDEAIRRLRSGTPNLPGRGALQATNETRDTDPTLPHRVGSAIGANATNQHPEKRAGVAA